MRNSARLASTLSLEESVRRVEELLDSSTPPGLRSSVCGTISPSPIPLTRSCYFCVTPQSFGYRHDEALRERGLPMASPGSADCRIGQRWLPRRKRNSWDTKYVTTFV